jgi:hypothetical protein
LKTSGFWRSTRKPQTSTDWSTLASSRRQKALQSWERGFYKADSAIALESTVRNSTPFLLDYARTLRPQEWK